MDFQKNEVKISQAFPKFQKENIQKVFKTNNRDTWKKENEHLE